MKFSRKEKIIFTTLISILLLSVINQANPAITDSIQSFFSPQQVKAESIGDAEVEPHIYWYAPENSFGISETKTVNWTYFKQLFLAHTDWSLEYKRYESSEWTNGLDYLTIERTWNDSGFWKFNLILDVPVDIYSARFTFGVDLPCLQYVEKEGYEVWINYSANATENYSIMFNWSDIASIPNLVITKGIQDDMFWFRFRRDDIPAGHYEFDPTFGYEIMGSSWHSVADTIRGSFFTITDAGIADNISVVILPSVGNEFRCAIYKKSDNSYVGETERNNPSITTKHWETFEFSVPKPQLEIDTDYWLVLWGNATGHFYYIGGSTTNRYYDSETYNSFPGTLIPVLSDGFTYSPYSIYCSYTIPPPANTAPSYTGESIWDGTTNHSANGSCIIFSPVSFNITANDSDGDTMNITWERNGLTLNTTSGTNGTYRAYNTSFADTCGTTYYYNVSINDGNNNWRNQSFSFTTVTPPTAYLKTPANGSTTPKTPRLEVYANDSCSLPLNVYWYENTTGSWLLVQTNTSVPANSSANYTFINATASCKTYYYRVAINNTYCNVTYEYQFTTPTIGAPTISFPNPTNNSYDNALSFTFNATIEAPHDDTFNWTIWCSTHQSSSANRATNGSKTLSISGLKYCTQYFVWVNATGNCSTSSKALYYFNTVNSTTPAFSNEVPANTSIDTEFDMTWNVTIEQEEGEWFQVWLNSSHGETNLGTGHNTSYPLPISGLDWCTKYYVTVTVSTNCSTVVEIFEFTTKAMAACTFSNEDPLDTSVGAALNTDFQVDITSPDSEYFNYTIESNSGNTTSANDQTTGTKTLEMYELSYDTLYTIWVNTTNNCSNDSSDIYHFTTLAITDYTPPTINVTTASPTNNSYEIDRHTTQLNIWINDSASLFNWTIQLSNGNSSSANDASNGTKICYVNLSYCTDYIWWINTTDGTNVSNATLYFHTENISASVFSNENPTNNSGANPISLTWNVTITSPSGEYFNWTIESSNDTSSFSNNASNGSKTLYLSELDYNTNYTVWVNTTNNCSITSSAIYHFITRVANAPILSFENPTNNSYDVPTSTTQLNITIEDPDGDTFNYNWFFSCGIDNLAMGNSNGSKVLDLAGCGGLDYCTQYYWQVNVTDGTNTTNATYYFTTENISASTFSNPSPANNSYENEVSFTWNVTIENPMGEEFTWWINSSHGETNSGVGHNGSKTLSISGLSYCTKYEIQVNATNNCSQWSYATYYFYTKNMSTAIITGEDPTNNSEDNALAFTWNVTIEQPEGAHFNWTIECSNGDTSSANGETNGSKSLAISGLAYSNSYTVWVNVTNNCSVNSYATYYFTVMDEPINNPPSQSNPTPTNGTSCVYPPPQTCIQINDAEGSQMNITFWSNSSGTWVAFGENLTVNNGTYCWNNSNFSAANTTYYWSVNASDGSNWTNITYHFTTSGGCPWIVLTYPTNGSTGISLTPTIQVWAFDSCGLALNVFFYQNTSGSWVNNQSNISISANTSHNWTYDNATQYSTRYYFMVSVNNTFCNTTYEFYFTTKSEPTNIPPTQSNPSPGNGTTTTAAQPQLCITVNDSNGDVMNITWYSNSSGSWVLFNTNASVTNGTFCFNNSNFSGINITYYWSVNASDGTNWTNATYHFISIPVGDPTSPADGYIFAWGETLTQLCVNISNVYGYGMYYEFRQNGSVINNSAPFDYTNHTINFTDQTNNSAFWESSKSRISTGAAFTAQTEFNDVQYENISTVNATGVNTSDCAPPIWSHHNFTFDLSGYNINNITNMEVHWRGYSGYHTGGAKPKWNWGTTMYFDTDGPNWYDATSTTPYTTSSFTPTEEWLNYTLHHEMLDWINDDGNLTVALEHTGALDCSTMYTDYIELVVTTKSGGVGNGTYCTDNVSWWNANCGVTWYWDVYIIDSHGNTDTTTYTFHNPPCTFDVVSYPINNTDGICPCCIPLSVDVLNANSSIMNLTFYSNLSIDYWDYFYLGEDGLTFANITNGTYSFTACVFNIYNYTYYWNFSMNDGVNVYNSPILSFTTAVNESDCNFTFVDTDLFMDDSWIIAIVIMFSIPGLLAFVYIKKRRN